MLKTILFLLTLLVIALSPGHDGERDKSEIPKRNSISLRCCGGPPPCPPMCEED